MITFGTKNTSKNSRPFEIEILAKLELLSIVKK